MLLSLSCHVVELVSAAGVVASPWGGGPPADPGGFIGAKLWRRQWRPLGRGDEDNETAASPRGGQEMVLAKTGAPHAVAMSKRQNGE